MSCYVVDVVIFPVIVFVFCNYSAICKKPLKTSVCNCSEVLQVFTSRLDSYTIGMLDRLIVDRWGASE
jgi:hypothetical protein